MTSDRKHSRCSIGWPWKVISVHTVSSCVAIVVLEPTSCCLSLVFRMCAFPVGFFQTANSRLSSTLYTMTASKEDSVQEMLRLFFQPFRPELQRSLDKEGDNLFYQFLKENNCTLNVADWSLEQLGEFYCIMVPIIANSCFHDNAEQMFPEIKKLLKTHRQIQTDDRVRHMHDQLGQCSRLRAEVDAFLLPYIPVQSKKTRKRRNRHRKMWTI